MRIQVKLYGIAVFLVATGVVAQPLYKSVNEQGDVTFSDKPPANAVEVQEVQVQPGPSDIAGWSRVARTASGGPGYGSPVVKPGVYINAYNVYYVK